MDEEARNVATPQTSAAARPAPAEKTPAQGNGNPIPVRSLAIKEKALGPNHPDVAQRLKNLAALYRATNRVKEAEAPEERVEAIRAIRR